MLVNDQLNTLGLSGMERMWQTMEAGRNQHTLSLEEGLGILLQAEQEERDHKRLERLEKAASFRYQASLPEISFHPGRGLDKNLILSLSNLRFLDDATSVLVCGSTGSEKSYLISALGHRACEMGYKVMYYGTSKLFQELKIARAENKILRLFNKLSKQDLLILDDFGLSVMDSKSRHDLMEIIEDRHGRSSTIIASQLPLAKWYEIFGDSTIADAIMDRLIHTSHKIEIKGESMRKKKVEKLEKNQ